MFGGGLHQKRHDGIKTRLGGARELAVFVAGVQLVEALGNGTGFKAVGGELVEAGFFVGVFLPHAMPAAIERGGLLVGIGEDFIEDGIYFFTVGVEAV